MLLPPFAHLLLLKLTGVNLAVCYIGRVDRQRLGCGDGRRAGTLVPFDCTE